MQSSSQSSSSQVVSKSRQQQIEMMFADCATRTYTLEDTIRDWKRNIGSGAANIYFQGKPVFEKSEGSSLDASKLEHKFDEYFSVDPLIKNYILNYAHQNGFLQISETVTKPDLVQQNKLFACHQNRFDFIQNADGSMTYIEYFYINSYMDFSTGKQVVSKEKNRPLVIGSLASKIYLDETGEVKQKFIEDKFLIVSPEGADLIHPEKDKSPSTIETRYNRSLEQIEKEFDQRAVTKQSFLKRASGFLRQHWGKILIGGIVTGLVVGAIVAGLFSFGIGTIAAGAIGGGVVAGLGLLGLKIGAGVGIGIGTAAIVKTSIVVGASVGVAAGTAMAYRKEKGFKQSEIMKTLAAKKGSTSSRQNLSAEISAQPQTQTPKHKFSPMRMLSSMFSKSNQTTDVDSITDSRPGKGKR